MTTAPLSKETAEKALAVVAKYLGPYTGQSKGQPCPTGEDAYRHGTGVTLDMEWYWPSSGPTPTILGEGGDMTDWVYYVGVMGAEGLDEELAKIGVRAVPYSGYALGLFYDDWL